MKSFRLLMPWPSFGLLMLIVIAGFACKTGREARKTLPEHFNGRQMNEQLWENSRSTDDEDVSVSALPFYAVDTTIAGKKFTAVYLRNASFDSLAFSMVKSYEPFASSFFKMIEEQGIKGVIIDFRPAGESMAIQTSFSVSRHNSKTMDNYGSPVEISFITDAASDSRADLFINELRSSPLVAAIELKHKNSTTTSSQSDCFKPAAPDFNGQ